ncbi:MAG: hypothetical protein KJO30_10035 [Boseongicola sp.]|nr:hypothetical protein [Boseongicola sp.]NNJ66768.1 hypothetical protein [Boseongicola sp.]
MVNASLQWRESVKGYAAFNFAEAQAKCTEALSIYDELLDVLLDYISGLEALPSEKRQIPDEVLTKRLELSSVLIQSISAIETSLLSSSYATLAALLKQETDGLTRLQEYQVGKAKDGKTPNTVNHGTQAQRFFQKSLQPWAHLSQSDVSEYLSWHINDNRLILKRFPVFDEMTFNRICDVRCHNLTVLIVRLEQVFCDSYQMTLNDSMLARLMEPTNLLKRRIEQSF